MNWKNLIPSEKKLVEYKAKIKLIKCPHCKSYGTLISYGHQYGYTEDFIRGKRRWRVLCKNGCGKISSALIGRLIPNHIVTTDFIWKLLEGITSGLCPNASWENTSRTFTIHSAYRLYNKILKNQYWLRNILCNLQEPPNSTSNNPFTQTFDHLKAIFSETQNPISEFQWKLQIGFLPS